MNVSVSPVGPENSYSSAAEPLSMAWKSSPAADQVVPSVEYSTRHQPSLLFLLARVTENVVIVFTSDNRLSLQMTACWSLPFETRARICDVLLVQTYCEVTSAYVIVHCFPSQVEVTGTSLNVYEGRFASGLSVFSNEVE